MRRGWIPLFLCIIWLSGCGFHLRGIVNIPAWLDCIAIINKESERTLAIFLQEQLESYHLQVTPEPVNANFWLVIQDAVFTQQVASVSSSTTPRQYQLIYTVQFKLQAKDGKEKIPSTKLTISRQLTINSDRILGSNEEENIIKKEMQREAAMRILTRLSHIYVD